MTLKRILLLFGIILILFVGFVGYQTIAKNGASVLGNKTGKVTLGTTTMTVEVVDSEKDKQVGLSKKKSLAENRGMLFLFEKPALYSFWMKNMQFPIDIIFLNDNKIVTIYDNIQPPVDKTSPLPLYHPKTPADKVLETKAGLSDKLKLKEGDTLNLTI